MTPIPKAAGPARHGVERALLIGRLERGHVEILTAESGEVRLWEAYEQRAAPRRFGHQPPDALQPVVDG